MLGSMMRIMARKLVFRTFGGRSKTTILPLIVICWCLLVWYGSWWLATMTSKALLLPPPPGQDLDHFRRNRSLAHYMDNIQVLIEPSTTPCAILEEVPVIIMVASSPDNLESRLAVRETWAKHQPTYFVLGLRGDNLEDGLLADTYIEAKQYSDMIVFDFHDHYQNLTLKTALMIHWTVAHCPQAQFMLKTDDDVLINPWTLQTVLLDHINAKLVGYRINDTEVHRDTYMKWFIPRWMFTEDTLPQYLSGTSYIISAEYLQRILKAARRVPLINLEDVYFTYLVANKKLDLSLSHDRRLNPYKPWLGIACAYYSLAATHSLSPDQMVWAWSKIENIIQNNSSCNFFRSYLDSDLMLY